MLVITNGDAIVPALRAAGVACDILPWVDVLHEGPVPQVLSDDDLAILRSKFIGEMSWSSEEEALARFRARDARLVLAFEVAEEILLVFEDDLYDQLQLLQILDRVVRHAPQITCRLAQADRPLIELGAIRLQQLIAEAPILVAKTLVQASSLWGKFVAPEKETFLELSDVKMDAMPFVHPAMVRLVEELPRNESGLTRTERTFLLALDRGPISFLEIFAAVQHMEERPFVADLVLASIVLRLMRANPPLIGRAECEEGEYVNPHALIRGSCLFVKTPAGELVARGGRRAGMGERYLGGLRIV